MLGRLGQAPIDPEEETMMDKAILVGGPAAGRKLEVRAGLEELHVTPNRKHDDPSRPRRRRDGRERGKRNCRYRRTDRGVGTGLIPRQYRYVP